MNLPPSTRVEPTKFSVPLANTHLTQGKSYVAFFSSDNYLSGTRSDAAMGATGDLYSGGTFVAHYGESSFNDLLTSGWSAPFGNSFDLAFRLDYQPVPEPSVVWLLCPAGLAILARSRFLRLPA